MDGCLNVNEQGTVSLLLLLHKKYSALGVAVTADSITMDKESLGQPTPFRCGVFHRHMASLHRRTTARPQVRLCESLMIVSTGREVSSQISVPCPSSIDSTEDNRSLSTLLPRRHATILHRQIRTPLIHTTSASGRSTITDVCDLTFTSSQQFSWAQGSTHQGFQVQRPDDNRDICSRVWSSDTGKLRPMVEVKFGCCLRVSAVAAPILSYARRAL